MLSFLLRLTPERLELLTIGEKSQPIYVDFVKGPLGYRRHRGGGRDQPLGRAMGLKPGQVSTVLDVTAGFGQDAFVLACLGCQVEMIERSPILVTLLQDGLQRLQQFETTIGRKELAERLCLRYGDAKDWLLNLSKTHYPEIIYLDPMYPIRRKSALVKKEMRILRQLVGHDSDAPLLLKVAITCAKQRVVVKRPQSAPYPLFRGNTSYFRNFE
jgi:16S rRNA (guanine1516-N2)-methyltransferase